MPAKFRYYLIDDYLNVTGTNSLEVAKAAFFDGSVVVIDAHGNVSFEETNDTADDDEPALMEILEHGTTFPEAP